MNYPKIHEPKQLDEFHF